MACLLAHLGRSRAVEADDADGHHVLVQGVRVPVVLDGLALVVGDGVLDRLDVLGLGGLVNGALACLDGAHDAPGRASAYQRNHGQHDERDADALLALRVAPLALADEYFLALGGCLLREELRGVGTTRRGLTRRATRGLR